MDNYDIIFKPSQAPKSVRFGYDCPMLEDCPSEYLCHCDEVQSDKKVKKLQTKLLQETLKRLADIREQ